MNGQLFTVNTIRICLDETKEELKGFICGICVKEPIYFQNTSQMISVIDDTYNVIGRPQPGEILRSFGGSSPAYVSYVGTPEKYYEDAAIEAMRGKKCTVDLIVQTRRYAEWQGILMSVDRKKLGEFHTMLQCVTLLEQLS